MAMVVVSALCLAIVICWCCCCHRFLQRLSFTIMELFHILSIPLSLPPPPSLPLFSAEFFCNTYTGTPFAVLFGTFRQKKERRMKIVVCRKWIATLHSCATYNWIIHHSLPVLRSSFFLYFDLFLQYVAIRWNWSWASSYGTMWLWTCSAKLCHLYSHASLLFNILCNIFADQKSICPDCHSSFVNKTAREKPQMDIWNDSLDFFFLFGRAGSSSVILYVYLHAISLDI